MSPEALYDWIMAVPDGEAQNYDDAARIIAKAMIEFVQVSPIGVDALRGLDAIAFGEQWKEQQRAQHDAAMDRARGPTGFQFGWAYNALRTVLDMEAAGNPAIVEIG